MKKDLVVRAASFSDLPVLRQFEQGLIATERPMDPTLKKGANIYYDLEGMMANPDVELVIAELAGKPVGCGYARLEKAKSYLIHTRHAYLGFMFVEPAHRGMGINAAVVERLRQFARSREITEMRLEVYCSNEAAIRAYEKAGFERLLIEMRMPV